MLAIADSNNFYVSCERLFNPTLKGKPVVVLSNCDGCVIARSEEAKILKIPMGLPFFKGKEFFKKNQVHVFSSNYTLYGDLSARIMSILREFSASVEVYSIDESFLDLSGMEYFDLRAHGLEMRRRILQEVGIPVTIGLSLTKTLSKMANRFAKKEHRTVGVYAASTPAELAQILRYTKVEDIWGVGPQYAALLQSEKILTAYDFLQLPDAWVQKHMTVVGLRTLNELRGMPCIPLELEPPPKKGICCSRSFGVPQTTLDSMREALSNYTSRVGEKLRKQGLCTSALTIFCHTNPFDKVHMPYWAEKTIQVHPATHATMELIHHANLALDLIYRAGYVYQKVGIFAHTLTPSSQQQATLFDPVNHERNNQATRAMDALNQRFGKGTVQLAIQGTDHAWKMKQDYLSSKFTTDIDGFLEID